MSEETKSQNLGYTYKIIKGLCNSIILICNKTNYCAIIDPSSYDKLVSTINELKVTPKMILLTHGHYDHIFYAENLKEIYSIPIIASKQDEEYLLDPEKNHSRDTMGKKIIVNADRFLFSDGNDSEMIELGELMIRAILTPGHTIGGTSYFIDNETEPIVFSGDTLFKGTIGRTDLYGGNFSKIIESIEKKLFILPDKTIIVPGHGYSSKIVSEKTTIEEIRKINQN